MKRTVTLLLAMFGVLAVSRAVAEEPLALEQVLGRVLATYPSVQTAALQVQRARLEQARVESLLGWNLGAQAGIARDAGFFGGTVDRADANTSLSRALESGGSVGVQGSYAHEDSSVTISPALANPLDTTRLDLSYRQPWGRGFGNPEYAQGLRSAEAGVRLAAAAEQALRDQLARQVAELYYAAAFTQARLASAQDAIARAQRLQKFIRDNARLGLTETKDLLQAEAQLRTQLAEQRVLQTAWEQQRTSLNRLMGRPWDAEFAPVTAFTPVPLALPDVMDEAAQYNPEIRRNRARIELAESAITRARDARKDRFDLVYSVGSRTRSGETQTGATLDESDVVGGVRLEYSRPLDRRGVDATLTQAQLDRDVALQDLRLVEEDLRYGVASLLAELDSARAALESAQRRLEAERRKLAEAEILYRRGRFDTARVIDFERELSAAELAVEQQQIELARRNTALAILRGRLWDTVMREGASK